MYAQYWFIDFSEGLYFKQLFKLPKSGSLSIYNMNLDKKIQLIRILIHAWQKK